mgnify:CR=1 FL=1
MGENVSKQKVVEAASILFFQKGYHGTSVRDIAKKASVNVSLISYYFKGKQGLFEHAVTDYYEEYLHSIETLLKDMSQVSAIEQLKELTQFIIQYKQMHLQLSCLIQRELSLDSIFVREMAVTYLAKENYFLKQVFQNALQEANKRLTHFDYLFMQLKGMLITPYMLHNDWRDQVVGQYSHDRFVSQYVQTIHQWIDFIVST